MPCGFAKANKIRHIISSHRPYSYINDGHIIQDGNIRIIKVTSPPPDNKNRLKEQAFTLLIPYLSKDIEKASVIWQKDEFSYGKMASIANVYIQNYLDRQISIKDFIDNFKIDDVEPAPLHKNNIAQITVNSVSQQLIEQSDQLRGKADLYRLNGKYDSAIRIYKQALDLNPNDTIALFWLAEIYKSQNDLKLAEVYYTKALSIDPDFRAADDALFELKNRGLIIENKKP
jgi:tetratricopeptide (TPR) repeat protein